MLKQKNIQVFLNHIISHMFILITNWPVFHHKSIKIFNFHILIQNY